MTSAAAVGITPPFLTDDEIAEICQPLRMAAAQRRHLERLGLLVKTRPDGKPLVGRAEFERVLGAQATRMDQPVVGVVPRASSYAGSALEAYHQCLRESAAIISTEKADAQACWRRHWRARKLRRLQARAALVRHHAAKRRAARIQRTPPWVDLDAILKVYEEAQALTLATGIRHHVDHEIPLQGELVSGLHVHTNLRAIPARDNILKSNRFEAQE